MNRRAITFALDVAVLALAFFFAYVVRFDGLPPGRLRLLAMIQLPYTVLLQITVLSFVGLHKTSWRYVSIPDLLRIGAGLAVSTAVLLVFRLGLPADRFHVAKVPLGVIGADSVFAFVGLAATRVLRRLQTEYLERQEVLSRRSREPERVLLIGAGRAGSMVAKELARRPDVGLEPVGFVDDDQGKVGSYVQGVKVYGTTDQLARIARDLDVHRAVITIANATGATIRRLHEACREAGLDVKIIPGLYEILQGKVNVSRIRNVGIEDLLGREPVELDREAIAAYLSGKRVLVTGAGGSIGSELCRQIVAFDPAALYLLDQAETALFYMERELRAQRPDLELRAIVADICDRDRLAVFFRELRPEVVFHAAAYKHVPMMESNEVEAAKNNVFGSLNVIDLAVEAGAEVVVNVSTDKAVNPTSVMGATKRVAEMYVQARSGNGATKLVAVRFGNVLGSSGSVIPIFREQIAAGGPVTVTHPEMKRYFMTIPEACQLVMQAAALGAGGEIFVLDMGEPVRILDLARDMIRLSGLEPEVDVPIVFTGVRPGEKLFEELALDGEGVDRTRHPKIFIGRLGGPDLEALRQGLEALREAVESCDAALVRRRLQELVPEYRPAETDRRGESGS